MMRATLVAFACAAAAACAARAPQGTPLASAVVDPYLKIQAALAADKTDDVKANADAVAKAAGSAGGDAAKVAAAAGALAGAATIVEARAKFGVLSDELMAYMKAAKLTPPEGVRVAFCPMANKPWLQTGQTIANPYYGSEMLTCGEFR